MVPKTLGLAGTRHSPEPWWTGPQVSWPQSCRNQQADQLSLKPTECTSVEGRALAELHPKGPPASVWLQLCLHAAFS